MKKAAFLALAMLAAASLPLLAQAASPGPNAPGTAPCADPLAVVRAFYDANDAQRFDRSAGLLSPEAEFATWATGVNGHVMAQKHLRGRAQIQPYLPDAHGLSRRLPGSPADGPIYHETKVKVAGDTVRFMLEPDRKRPNGRLYNPFSVEVQLEGCRIRSLTVIEHVTWL